MKGKISDILLIEDNPDDVFLIEFAVKKANLSSKIFSVNDGEKGLSHLAKLVNEKKKLPDLILLDINLPKITGLEVLKKIKSDESIKSIPTVVFTSSDSPFDMNYCYQNEAELYIRKPNNIHELKKIMTYICQEQAELKV